METIGTSAIDLLNLLSYQDGALYWKEKPCRRVMAGSIAGNVNGANRHQITYRGKVYMRSRLIWEMHNGIIPEGMEVDHEDRNTLNDSIGNLRLLNRSNNAFNRGVQSNNKLGLKGVSKDVYSPNKFRAFIRVDGKTKNLGLFDTAEEAQSAYVESGGLL